MTKEQFIAKWENEYDSLGEDLEAVIAHEIAKAQEAKLKHADQVTDQVTDQPQPVLNPIEQAYERGEKIRAKFWKKGTWAIKNSDTHAIDEKKVLWDVQMWDFKTKPEKWELYTEPTEQPSSQAKLDNSFDKERFERMFRAVYQSTTSNFDKCIEYTKENLTKLDAYYAEKGGNNE